MFPETYLIAVIEHICGLFHTDLKSPLVIVMGRKESPHN